MKNLSQAKIEAYVKAIKSGEMKSKLQEIYNLLCKQPLTTEQLRDMGYKHQSLTAALSRLEDLGVIYKSALVQGRKRRFSLWKVETDALKIVQRREAIEDLKFKAWVKQGEKNGYFLQWQGKMQHYLL